MKSLLQLVQAWRIGRARRLLQRAAYDGAALSETDRWRPVSDQVNHLISGASPLLRSRVRDLVRNFPLFSRGVSAFTAYTVGRGARFQSLAVKPDGTPDMEVRARIEGRFAEWMAQDADISGTMHFYELQQLLCRQIMECGEAFFCFAPRSKFNTTPLALLPVEPDRLGGLGSGLASEGFDSGIEFDPRTGERLAYHIADDGYGTEIKRVPAEDVLHIYRVLRPGQLRGVSPFAPAILTARAMSQYVESELDASRMAAKYLAMITTPTPDLFQSQRGVVGAKSSQNSAAPVEELENSIIEYLRPGEDIKFAATPPRPGDSFDRFCRFASRMVSISIDIPYEILSGDYSGINYSTARAARGDASVLLTPHKFLIEQRFSAPVFRRWLDMEALTQNYLPHYWQNRGLYQRHSWISAGMPSVDPQRDGRAAIEAIAACLTSPQEVILSHGADPDQVIAEQAAFREALRRAGLSTGTVSTSLSSNPASLEEQPVNMEE